MKKVVCQLWKKSSCEYISQNSIVAHSFHLNEKHRLLFLCNQAKTNTKIINLNRYYFCNVSEEIYKKLLENQTNYGLMVENNNYPCNTRNQKLEFENYEHFLSFFKK